MLVANAPIAWTAAARSGSSASARCASFGERGALPRLIRLDRADRAGADLDREGRAVGEREQVARDLGIAQLAEDLDDAGRVVAEQDLGLLDHLADRQRAQPAREHRTDRAIGLAERDQEPLGRRRDCARP